MESFDARTREVNLSLGVGLLGLEVDLVALDEARKLDEQSAGASAHCLKLVLA